MGDGRTPDTNASQPHPVLPFRCSMWGDDGYHALDPGIRFAVRLLHAHGIETGQSCEGGDGHAYDHPTIDLGGAPEDAAGFAALAALASYSLPVRTIEYVWQVTHGTPVDSFWRITFREPMHAKAADLPMFVRHYRYNVDLYEREQSSARPDALGGSGSRGDDR